MRSIVTTNTRSRSAWSSALDRHPSITIEVDRAMADRGRVYHDAGTIVLNDSVLDTDHVFEMVSEAIRLLADQRPALRVVGEPDSTPAAPAQTSEPAEVSRPTLRLVKPATARTACLPGCEYSADHDGDGDVCSATVGAVDAGRDEQLSVTVYRFQDQTGAAPAVVAVGHLVGGRAEDPQELTPVGARELAAQLLAAADLAEQANKNRARQTA